MSEANLSLDPNAGTDGSALLDTIRGVVAQWNDRRVPDQERYCGLQDDQYDLLANNQYLLNRDFGGEMISVEESVIKAWGAELVRVDCLEVITDGTRIQAVLWQDPRVLRMQLAEAVEEVGRLRGILGKTV